MPQPARDVTATELSVLEALWERGPATIRQLTERLYPGGGPSHYATVQKLLDRLELKACVTRRQKGRANLFSARIAREELIARRLQETADKLCGGSLTPLLTQLVQAQPLSRADLSELRKVVARLDRQRRKG